MKVPFEFFIARAAREPGYKNYDYSTYSVVFNDGRKIPENELYPGVEVVHDRL